MHCVNAGDGSPHDHRQHSRPRGAAPRPPMGTAARPAASGIVCFPGIMAQTPQGPESDRAGGLGRFWVISGGSVAFFGNREGPSVSENYRISLVSKRVAPPFSKDISVPKFSRYEEWRGIIHDSSKFLLGKKRVLPDLKESFFVGVDHHFGPLRLSFPSPPRASNRDSRNSIEIVCRRLAIIFDLECKGKDLTGRAIFNLCLGNSDICTQLTPSSFFRTLYEIASSHPKEDGREGQYDSEDSKNFILPVVDVVTKTVSDSDSSRVETGNILFGLTVGGLLIVLLYAGLKRR
jgi:hypothetical protein